MKEFEKWWDENMCHDWGEYTPICRTTWKAALKWVKTLPSSGTYKFTEPMRFIKQELEE